MAASAHLLLSALAPVPTLPEQLQAAERASEGPRSSQPHTALGHPGKPSGLRPLLGISSGPAPGPYLSELPGPGPLTSEPPLPDAAPLTSEPPLASLTPLTSEPTAAAITGGAQSPGV
ncbi:hypothetical protein [Streptomyces sp. NPDC059076]|uniref:hypothetical protein n=1 Tax=unclassified Streptomyces TaxID=2593676 RepID=UPI00368643AB